MLSLSSLEGFQLKLQNQTLLIVQSQHPLSSSDVQPIPPLPPPLSAEEQHRPPLPQSYTQSTGGAPSFTHPTDASHLAAMRAHGVGGMGGGMGGGGGVMGIGGGPPPAFISRPPLMMPHPVPPPEPPWIRELLAHKTPNKPTPVCLAGSPRDIKQSQDRLCVTLLKAIDILERDGPVKAKLKLNRYAGKCDLKDLIATATELAYMCFEQLPPYLMALRPTEIELGSPVLTQNASSMINSVAAMNPPLGPPPNAGCLFGVPLESPPPLGDFHNPALSTHVLPYTWASEPPVGGGGGAPSQSTDEGGVVALPAASAPPPAPAEWNEWYSQSYIPPPTFYSMHFARLNEARRKCGFDGADFFPSTKKGPAVGDRPLTPPAQGWYAKYSSGVTGVVWDRVHQAWVVSWTLAGKRTFRHFTCKSYGGFDKARDAAIEFRLARNREIAAYNKRSKDKT